MSGPVVICAESAQWAGCYDGGWQGEIVPEAFAHPAKVSRALIRRIYEHAFAAGWLRAGDVVADPFGGIAGTALDAMWNGLTWVGCELEPRFVGLAQQNLDLWRRKYGSKSGFGSARILQGDSRKLAGIIAGADLVCSSPPYAEGLGHGGAPTQKGGKAGDKVLDAMQNGYGQTSGQLGAMKEGEAPAMVISSPPYAAIATGAGGLNTKPGKDGQQSGRSPDSASQGADQHYGESAGQLSGMPDRGFDAVVSSPPYECARVDGEFQRRAANSDVSLNMPESAKGYGESGIGKDRSLGAQDTFWQAARDIVAQCHQILRPGGHAIWICKNFVRKGKIVPFSDQWQALCEVQGFRLVCRHQAMLVAHYGEQDGLFGATEQLTTARKSFFRRLAEAKGSPAIDWEDVICLERT